MLIKNILKVSEKPKLFQKSNSVMWTDDHISKQLLDVHLNPDIDLASRKKSSIDKTISWIKEYTKNEKLDILDLGCGPGLYTEILAKLDHNVTGVDFSQNSINYAKNNAEQNGLNINYVCSNYLDVDFEENSFDLVILIFTDFGVLNPDERKILLKIISKILRPGGLFIFDVINDLDIKSKAAPKNWEVTKSGFWKDKPYLALSESFLYEEEKVVLFQHTILDESENVNIYRFWTSLFSIADLENLLKQFSFNNIEVSNNVLPEENTWTGKNLTFFKAVNNK